MKIHPVAESVGKSFGMTPTESEAEMESISKALGNNPDLDGLLLGGFNADVIAIAATAVLRLEHDPEGIGERLDENSVRGRVVRMMEIAFAGLT
jgi:UDP-N-acetylmuramyl tripeptide synthase